VYVVHPILGTESVDVLRGIAMGEYRRYGGVIRRAPGTAGGGEFVRGGFLRELGQAVPSGAEQLLGLTQVAAAASVLNLGVSVIGFAVMAKKLNRLQRDMTRLIDMTSRNHDDVMQALAEVGERLIELRALALENRSLLGEVLDGIARIRKDLVDLQMARVTTRLGILQQTDGNLPRPELLEARQIFGEAREFARLGIAPDARGSLGWHEGLLRLRLWCIASASEVLLLRRADELDAAASTADAFSREARAVVGSWRDVFAPPNELAGLGRFGYSELHDGLAGETRARLHRLSGLDGNPSGLRTLESRGALAVAGALGSHPREGFLAAQMARASVLDFLEELGERAESLAEEAAFTAELRISYDNWERMRMPEATSIALIETGAGR